MSSGTSVILIAVGKKGSGKTKFVKDYLAENFAGYKKLINDVNAEYGEPMPPPAKQFIEKALKLGRGVVVCEEATSLFGFQRDDNTASIMTRSRHTGTCLIFCFHTFADIPRYIARNSDFLVVFKTGDVLEDVAKKFGRGNSKVLNAFLDIQAADMLTNAEGRQYSPKKIVML